MNKISITEKMLVIILVGSSFTIFSAQERPDIQQISQQLSKVSWHSIIDDNIWRYTIETQLDTGNGMLQQRKQRFSPDLSAEQKWQLIEHQHQAPTPQVLLEYRNTMDALIEEPEQLDTSNSKIVNLDTLKFDTHSLEFSEYTFSPALPMFDKDDEANFLGRLYVSKESGNIEYLTVSLKEPFKPSFSINLTRYELKIMFSTTSNNIHVVKIESHKQGRLMYVSEFNEKSVRFISDVMPVSNE